MVLCLLDNYWLFHGNPCRFAARPAWDLPRPLCLWIKLFEELRCEIMIPNHSAVTKIETLGSRILRMHYRLIDDLGLARLREEFQKMIVAGSDNALWVEADLSFHKEIYLSTHNEFFWPIGQLFSFALREMFEIAARGSHRPRAVVEHGDLMTAIVEGKPDLAETAARTLLRNAATDIDRIRAGFEK